MIFLKNLIFMKKYLQLRVTGQEAPGTQRWRYVLVALMMVLLSTANAWAQDQTISGLVKSSEDGEALPGVSLLVKGTNIGTVTDAEGHYQLKAPTGAVLVVSFVGFKN